MTIKAPGNLTPVASDFQFTHNGQVVAIICIQGMAGDFIAVTKKNTITNIWEAYHIDEFDDILTVDVKVKQASGMNNYIKSLIPKINEILLKLFPKSSTTTPPAPPPATTTYTLASLDSAIGTVLAWSPQTDGTLKVTSKV